MKPVLFITLLLSVFIVKGQEKEHEHVVQFTGVVVEGDSLKPMPFTHITIKNSRMGTISDYYGFFSFVAHTNDTIVFSSVGYERNEFVIPDSLEEKSYSIIHMMVKDTLLLKEFTVFPWPTREQFKQAFLTVDIPDDDLERAKKNLSRESMMAVAGKVPVDGPTTYKYALQNRYTQLYQAGGYPSLRLLDPIAWSQFIQAWKNGDFKKKGNIKYAPE